MLESLIFVQTDGGAIVWMLDSIMNNLRKNIKTGLSHIMEHHRQPYLVLFQVVSNLSKVAGLAITIKLFT